MRPDEIYLASFPFGGSAGTKLRPVLLLTGPIGDVPEILAAYISSVIPPALLPSDVVLDPTIAEYASTNLKTISVLRLHKLATIHHRSVVRRLGDCRRRQARRSIKSFVPFFSYEGVRDDAAQAVTAALNCEKIIGQAARRADSQCRNHPHLESEHRDERRQRDRQRGGIEGLPVGDE